MAETPAALKFKSGAGESKFDRTAPARMRMERSTDRYSRIEVIAGDHFQRPL
jgi:hypothetical protein